MEKTRSTGTRRKTIRISSKKKLSPLISSPIIIEDKQDGLGLLSKSKTLVINLLKITGFHNVPEVSTLEILEHRPPRHSGIRNASMYAPRINHKINAFSR